MEINRITKILSKNDSDIKLCSICSGQGIVRDNTWGSGYNDTVKCSTCNGTGRIVSALIEAEIDLPFDYKLTS